MLALQCGGSDGYSGITANPALGAAADILVRNGGTAILSETPEIYGAEHLLTRRAATPASRPEARRAHPLVGRLHRAQRRRDEQQSVARQQGGRPDDHPREVARRGGQGRHDAAERGLSTTPSRSPPRASSSWTRPATIRCRRPARSRAAPTFIAFTTGRGSAFGCKPTPSIKLATNSDIYRRMDRRHGHQLRRRARRRLDRTTKARRSSTSPGGRVRRAHQVGSCSATATPNSCPGRSGRRCDARVTT